MTSNPQDVEKVRNSTWASLVGPLIGLILMLGLLYVFAGLAT